MATIGYCAWGCFRKKEICQLDVSVALLRDDDALAERSFVAS
jgi:hypothetical protein